MPCRFRFSVLVAHAGLSFFLCAATPAVADPGDVCDFPAFAFTESPVRAEPHVGATALGTLPDYTLNGRDFQGAEFRVVEMRDGWVRITDVQGVDRNRTPGPDGWLEAGEIEFTITTKVAFAGPDKNSAIVSPVRWPYSFALQDCHGQWARISFNETARPDWSATAGPREYAGWVRGICAIVELGTCAGVSGDQMPEAPAAAAGNP